MYIHVYAQKCATCIHVCVHQLYMLPCCLHMYIMHGEHDLKE